ncbi:hypothetical protein AAIB48_19720 (plasmid) [Paraclostridium benzoelyticum]|uniref:hypothetical protein n=1 Tax=Paraclostridium TaxID=1849822 RepID=UPI0018FEF87E|nr:hypothetical protein [Paraclostridium bifermentans]MCU9809551.1 hypothetical protein [Paraclostridium sp. AKS46]
MSKNLIYMIFNSKDTKNSLYNIINPRLLYYSNKTEDIMLVGDELFLLEHKNRCIFKLVDFKNYLYLKRSPFNSNYLYRNRQNLCDIKHPKLFSKALEWNLRGRLKINNFRKLIVTL